MIFQRKKRKLRFLEIFQQKEAWKSGSDYNEEFLWSKFDHLNLFDQQISRICAITLRIENVANIELWEPFRIILWRWWSLKVFLKWFRKVVSKGSPTTYYSPYLSTKTTKRLIFIFFLPTYQRHKREKMPVVNFLCIKTIFLPINHLTFFPFSTRHFCYFQILIFATL